MRAWIPASKTELRLLALYFVGLVLITDLINVRPGVEFMTGATAVAATLISKNLRQFLKDWWFLLLGLLLWNLSGVLAGESPFPWHLNFMLNFDRTLFGGRDPVVWIQHSLRVPGQVRPLDVASVVSYNLHLPEPYIVGYFLWRLNRLAYLRFAASVLLLLVVCFLTFILFPAVPPWMASGRFGRIPGVINGFGPVLNSHPFPFHGTPIFYLFKLTGDPVAAFPSEHAAFPMLECLSFATVSKWATVGLAFWTVWVLFVVVYLGEHWVTDVIAGWTYAVVVMLFVVGVSNGHVGARVRLRRRRGIPGSTKL